VREITADSSLIDVAFAVGTALDRSGFTAVLTGGSAASFTGTIEAVLATACAVAVSGPIDIELIRAWSEREGSLEKCREFERVLSLATKSKPG